MKKGFTLIELLIVIVIIGILAGIVLSVLNPALQQQKANESVLRANTEKMCLALHACGATSTVSTTCDTWTEIGVAAGGANLTSITTVAPTGATYAGALSGTSPNQKLTITGTLSSCVYTCAFDFASGAPIATNMTGAGCTIQ